MWNVAASISVEPIVDKCSSFRENLPHLVKPLPQRRRAHQERENSTKYTLFFITSNLLMPFLCLRISVRDCHGNHQLVPLHSQASVWWKRCSVLATGLQTSTISKEDNNIPTNKNGWISKEDNKADDNPMAATIVRTYNINWESPSRVRTSAVWNKVAHMIFSKEKSNTT